MRDFSERISALSPERRQLLELLLEKERAGKTGQRRAGQKPEELRPGRGSGGLSEPFSQCRNSARRSFGFQEVSSFRRSSTNSRRSAPRARRHRPASRTAGS